MKHALVGDGEAVVEGGHVGADDEPGDVEAPGNRDRPGARARLGRLAAGRPPDDTAITVARPARTRFATRVH
jgi:hypothetical protein